LCAIRGVCLATDSERGLHLLVGAECHARGRAHGRFRVAAPGRLQIRRADGAIQTLIDGGQPQPPFHLIDVNAPDVSWDGRELVFAGLPDGAYDSGPVNNPGAWRIFAIRTDGTDLRQLTSSDEDDIDLSQFAGAAGGFGAYDDTDPAWLPDGRVVFSSTRWRSYGHYSGVRASNLHVVNGDGRISIESPPRDRAPTDRSSSPAPGASFTPGGGGTTDSPLTAPRRCPMRPVDSASGTA
jgi:hypothetical protein